MSKPIKPLAIGAFLVGALVLLASGIMLFGGNDFFKDKKRFVIFFDSALNGLNIGAPVKLQGVQIGNVKEISLQIDTVSGRIFKPVVIEIDPELLRYFSGSDGHAHSDKQRLQDTKQLIDAGLKARLETQSLLTGLLYVDLNFYYEKQGNITNLIYKDLPELPSVPTTVDEIRNTAEALISKVRQLPLEQMVKDLSETLRETRDLLKSDDVKKSLAALSKSLQETQQLMLTMNQQMGPLLNNANAAVTDTRANMQQMLPVLKATEQSLLTATKLLQESHHAVNAVETLATPDSPLGQALFGIRDASRSLKDLTESLERQPNAIIYGK
jgi:paraquat-inducible protein B